MQKSIDPTPNEGASLSGARMAVHPGWRLAAAGLLSFWSLFWGGRGLENFLGRPGEALVTEMLSGNRVALSDSLMRLEASPVLAESIVQLMGFFQIATALGFAGAAYALFAGDAGRLLQRLQLGAFRGSALILMTLILLQMFNLNGAATAYDALVLVSCVLTFKAIAVRADPTP